MENNCSASVGKKQLSGDAASQIKINEVSGPQRLTTGVFDQTGQMVYFGTAQGHIFRWHTQQTSAQAIKAFACGGMQVPPARMQLKPQQRCPFGTHYELDTGLLACLYPVTQIALHQGHLIRACRQGELGRLTLKTDHSTFYQAGHLRVLVPLEQNLIFGGRNDGQLQLYSGANKIKIIRSFLPRGQPFAAASAKQIIVVAQQGVIRFWHLEYAQAIAERKITRRETADNKTEQEVVWLHLNPAATELSLLQKNGVLRLWKLNFLQRRSKNEK